MFQVPGMKFNVEEEGEIGDEVMVEVQNIFYFDLIFFITYLTFFFNIFY